MAVHAYHQSVEMSGGGHEFGETVATVGPCRCTGGDRILSAAEAAAELGVSERHARRLASDGAGFRLGITWAFTAAAVRHLKQKRKK